MSVESIPDASLSQRKNLYTAADDALLTAALETRDRNASIDSFFKGFAALHPHHSFSSWRTYVYLNNNKFKKLERKEQTVKVDLTQNYERTKKNEFSMEDNENLGNALKTRDRSIAMATFYQTFAGKNPNHSMTAWRMHVYQNEDLFKDCDVNRKRGRPSIKHIIKDGYIQQPTAIALDKNLTQNLNLPLVANLSLDTNITSEVYVHKIYT